MSQLRRQKVGDYYASLHRFYDTVFEETGYYNLGWLPKGSKADFTDGQKNLVSLICEPFRRFSGGLILDAGCGQGAPAEQAAKDLGARVVGLELLARQLQACRARTSASLSFVQGDACILPFANNCLDGIYSLESAFHYPDKAAFIKECARVLKPGGLFSLADLMSVKKVLNPVGLCNIARAAGAPGFFSERNYSEAAIEAGLAIVHSESITDGIARSFRNIAYRTVKHWKNLRTSFPASVLAGVVIVSWSHPLTYRLLPVEYRWMVFEKSNR